MNTIGENNCIKNSQLLIKAKVGDIEIPENDPFVNDKLDRKRYAEVLTSVVNAYLGGAVMALNGAWGTGKTTFVKMWKQQLKSNGFPVIYYNAWEDDISEEPLLSLLRGLKNANDEEEKKAEKDKKLHSVFTVGSKIITGIVSGAIKGFVEKYGKVVAEAAKGGVEALEKEITDSLEKEDETTVILEQFKEELSKYVAFVCDNDNNKHKPLVYFIDELDRCNPTFAVKVLERIKHLFDVPNVVFVLSIDKQQLAFSINGYYGSDNINSMEYLRRFIDIDYNLPEPDPEKYCEFLYDLYGFADFIDDERRKKALTGSSYGYEKDGLLSMAKQLVKYKHLNLRQTERIFALARIGLCEMSSNSKLFANVYFLLAYLKVCEPIIFENIKHLNYRLQELIDALENLATDELIKEDEKGYSCYLPAVCHLLFCYAESVSYVYRKPDSRYETIYDYQSSDQHSNVTFNKFNKEHAFDFMNNCNQNRPTSTCRIEHFTDKLSLLEPFRIE